MSERDNESFDLDDECLSGPTEDGTDYDRLLDRVDKRVRNQGKRGKAAWSKLEEVLADKKLEKTLRDFDEELCPRPGRQYRTMTGPAVRGASRRGINRSFCRSCAAACAPRHDFRPSTTGNLK